MGAEFGNRESESGSESAGPGHTVVTILCDGGGRHASKFWSDSFLASRGLSMELAGPAPSMLGGAAGEAGSASGAQVAAAAGASGSALALSSEVAAAARGTAQLCSAEAGVVPGARGGRRAAASRLLEVLLQAGPGVVPACSPLT